MSSLSDFAKNYKPKEKKEMPENLEQVRQNFSEKENQAFDENAKQAWEKYSNMDENQLQNQLFKEASKLKANGQFDYNSLYSAVQNMGDMISPQQKENMLKLLEQLR